MVVVERGVVVQDFDGDGDAVVVGWRCGCSDVG